ncbi:MAG: hypothetical protein J2O48_01730, partial [Solirubrobacterales bacterium]|nr:hypothetical protein [Solirubrobacterales bacterium]
MHKCSHLRGPLALLAAVLGLGLALLAATPAGAANADWTNSAAWSDASVTQPGATSSPTAVSCADKDSCLAVDSQGYGTSYDGTNWSAAHDTGIGVRLLSCVSSTACFGVSNKNSYVTFNGTSAGSVHTLAPQPPDWDATVSSLSCKSTSFCMAAVDENHGSSYISYVYRFDGSSWHRSTSVTKGQDASVSCATPSYCVAVSSGLSSSQVGEAQVFN